MSTLRHEVMHAQLHAAALRASELACRAAPPRPVRAIWTDDATLTARELPRPLVSG